MSRFTWKMLIMVLLTTLVLGAALAYGQTAAKPAAPEAAKTAPATAAAPVAAPGAKMSKLAEAIAKTPQGTGKGQINPAAAQGFMGIPGAPTPFWFFGILWGIWVGWIFSTVGAFGGIMAGVGHISVFGLANYASSFRQTNPALNKLLTDSIRTSNQYLVGLSSLMSSITYYRMGRLVLPLGLALAIGGIAGAYLIPVLTAGKISLKAYVGYFGLIVLVIGCFLFYDTTPKGQEKKKKASAAAKAFQESMKKGGAAVTAEGVRVKTWGLARIDFTFYGVEFHFNPIWPLIGGFFIAAISAFIGVGGGFLYVPFLTSVTGLPMYVVAGTSALAVFVSMITSIFTFMFVKGTPIDFFFIGAELIGIAAGSIVGPMTSKYIPDIWLKRLFVVLAIYVGLGYTIKGFAGVSLFPGL
ncbi:MAG: sulfite exporter TauE/SafE family protein [Thermodesulfobacteriota bacterium]